MICMPEQLALCGDPAQLRRARPPRFDRRRGGAEDAGRACGDHRQGHAAQAPPIVPMRLQPLPEFEPFEQPVIAHDKVRYVGEPMAVVLADSVAIGEDALEAIEVEIESLPPVADWTVAQADKSLLFDRPRHQPLAGVRRRARRRRRGLREGAVCAPREAAHRPPLRPHHGAARRHGGLGRGQGQAHGLGRAPRCRSSTGASSPSRSSCRSSTIEMIENDVGGGFGARGEFYPEDFLIPFAARHLNRPVKWIEDRRENLMAMNHAREAEMRCRDRLRRATARILGAARRTPTSTWAPTCAPTARVGARNVAQFMAGPYRIPARQARRRRCG